MTCRICYEPCSDLSPCACTGSMKYVHPKCLHKWRRMSNATACEICHRPYPLDHHAMLAFLMFCLGMLSHKHPGAMMTMFLPFPYRYFAAGAFVANYSFI